MRIAILSDIHSNIVAFEAVVADARAHGRLDRVWSLGDIVGYGPRPNECIDLLRSFDHVAVAGNHDLGAIGRTSLDVFNPDAAACCRWNGERLTPENRLYLEEMDSVTVREDFTLVHGSLRDPVWEYLVHEEAASGSFRLLETRYLLVGHSHLPFLFREIDGDGVQKRGLSEEEPVVLGETRIILCPGGVGQPRDGDPRAAYAIYDTDTHTIAYYRIAYDVSRVQREMLDFDLPSRMAERLAHGW